MLFLSISIIHITKKLTHSTLTNIGHADIFTFLCSMVGLHNWVSHPLSTNPRPIPHRVRCRNLKLWTLWCVLKWFGQGIRPTCLAQGLGLHTARTGRSRPTAVQSCSALGRGSSSGSGPFQRECLPNQRSDLLEDHYGKAPNAMRKLAK